MAHYQSQVDYPREHREDFPFYFMKNLRAINRTEYHSHSLFYLFYPQDSVTDCDRSSYAHNNS